MATYIISFCILFLSIILVQPMPTIARRIDAARSLAESPQIRKFNFKVQYANATRLCHTKSLVTINGQFPGPTMYVREGDTVIVKVQNRIDYNVTIHWHGVRQFLTAWADGPSYVTQCPIQKGHSYTHKFEVVEQRGTLFYHAHVSWLRATLHGAFIMLPKADAVLPYPKPANEHLLYLGEWWNDNVEDVIEEALRVGGGYQHSDALTINGQPGALYNCSLSDTTVFDVVKGETYLFRIVNAAVNFQLYVSVVGHSLTVVEADAEYTKPYTTDILVLAPGQTTNVLLTADQPVGQYLISATVFTPTPNLNIVPFPQTPTTAILRYKGAETVLSSPTELALPKFPSFNDSIFAAGFTKSLKGLSTHTSGFDLPLNVDKEMLFTIGYAVEVCPTCNLTVSPNPRLRMRTSINNVSFVEPTSASLMEAYYYNISGVYEDDFPSDPIYPYNYTGAASSNFFSVVGTKVKVIEFGESVQIVFQDTSTFFFEGHPIHLHGTNFFVVGEGFGTFDPVKNTANFNLVDPPSRNTVAVPSGRWSAIRFKAVNPGMWFMHCHFDIHTSWGMAMAFLVKNGQRVNETLPAPPSDLPKC
ncbi:hypothetical protein KP509_12G063000 [Ceratopteris richardii]|uniref:Laccase n=1 Tax=Ceratopteris richardii TaxID=49495 RepID=A0A8T2TPF9_CERRI|nr:hypothetical protein KP509_12G063000 [Ceratopteris richardii]